MGPNRIYSHAAKPPGVEISRRLFRKTVLRLDVHTEKPDFPAVFKYKIFTVPLTNPNCPGIAGISPET